MLHGNCKPVVGRKTVIDIEETCPIRMADDGTGAFRINTDRDKYLGGYFAEPSLAGDGIATHNLNGEEGATHAQGFRCKNFRTKKGGG